MPERMIKAGKIRHERGRLLSVGAGLLLWHIVGVRDESLLQISPYGKLFSQYYPAFNLSHSGEWCVVVRSEGDIGVDIQKMNELHLHIAHRVYTMDEMDWMNEDPLQRFFVLWTLKESLMKATGLGFHLDPLSFDVLPLLDNKPVCIRGVSWYAATSNIDGYYFSVCGRGPIGELEWTPFPLSPHGQ